MTGTLRAGQFLCQHCKQWFPLGDDTESREEFAAHFPGADIKDAAMVCDDCWKRLQPYVARVQDEGQ